MTGRARRPARAAARGLLASGLAAAALAFPAVLAAGAAGCRRRPPPPAPDVAAEAGGVAIRYAEFQDYLARALGDPDAVVASGVLSQLFDQFLEERLLQRLAVDRGLVPAGAAPRRAIDALLRQAAGPPPAAAEIEDYYRRHRQELARPERVRLRQILTEDRATAERAHRAIERGEDFQAVARRLSRDTGAAGGGYQGELARSDLPPSFVDVIFSLRPGEVSRVVPAEYGFHIFQVAERLPQEVMPLAAASGEIAARLRRERADRARASLVRLARSRYNAQVYERNLPFEYEGSYGENHATRPASAGAH
ncbi:MAG TPA: peptidylprolyl isomerase [Thermoanaerobaculia bacterium]|nr:peptidylprolyl isomerase [Thermoanaerobaculia bacterium]